MKLLLWFVLMIPLFSFGHSDRDSLRNVYQDESVVDTLRLQALNKLANSYKREYPDSMFYFAGKLIEFSKSSDKFNSFQFNGYYLQGAANYYATAYNKSVTYYNKALTFAQDIRDKELQSKALYAMGLSYFQLDNLYKSEELYLASLDLKEQIGDVAGSAALLNSLGIIYKIRGDFSRAIEMYMKSLRIAEVNNNKVTMANLYSNISNVYKALEDYEGALEYQFKALKLRKELNDSRTVANSHIGLGNIYRKLEQPNEALDHYHQSLHILDSIQNKAGIAICLNNLGSFYFDIRNIPDAIKVIEQSISIKEELGDSIGIANSLINLSAVHEFNGQISVALEEMLRAYRIAHEFHAITEMTSSSKGLYKLHFKNRNYGEALNRYEEYITLRDSVQSESNQKELIRQQYKYQYEKQAAADSVKAAEAAKVKDALLAAERAENKQNKLEAKQQEQQKYFLFGGLALALLFGGFIFNRFRVTSKQKGIIEEQKQQVDEAYDELEEKNTEILDSINYAKRIQSAILPPNKVVREYLPESFVLYKPKDIVAGDFYWLESVAPNGALDSEGTNRNIVLFAACDCTGHGVPGAMVSVVCNNGLNRSVREYGLTDPGKILDKTREIVIGEFEKSEEEVKDGMDIALCSLELAKPDRFEPTQEAGQKPVRFSAKLQYAGAHNPLWIIRNVASEVEEIKANLSAETRVETMDDYTFIEVKADKQPIGKYDQTLPYTTHEIELQPGDSIYIFSDGFADQFGGERGKKFKAKNFKNLLLTIQDESMERQRELIDDAFEKWMGELEQLDDVCVIGVRI